MTNSAAIDITITGTKDIIDKLFATKDLLDDFSEPLEEAGKELAEYFGEYPLSSRGGVFGIPWAGLAASTEAYKKKHYRAYETVPLMRTGAMMQSFFYAADPLGLIIGNTMPYFKYHQSTAPRHKIPWRPMMWINEPVKGIIKQPIVDYLNTEINAL